MNIMRFVVGLLTVIAVMIVVVYVSGGTDWMHVDQADLEWDRRMEACRRELGDALRCAAIVGPRP